MKWIPSQDCSVCSVYIYRVTITNSQATTGCFSSKDLREADTTGHYFGMSVYQFTVDAINARILYREGRMAVTRKNSISRQKVKIEVSRSNGILHTV